MVVRLPAGVLPYANDRATLEALADRPVILFTRTAKPLGADVEEVRAFYDEIGAVLGRLPLAELDLVIDSRQPVGRNDPAFEAALPGFKRDVLSRVRRCVTVVRSTVGRLQVARFEQDLGSSGFAIVGSVEDADALLGADGWLIAAAHDPGANAR